jgi:hypothetical protein
VIPRCNEGPTDLSRDEPTALDPSDLLFGDGWIWFSLITLELCGVNGALNVP